MFARMMSRTRLPSRWLGLLVAVLAVWHSLILGDPLLVINHTLRQTAIFAPDQIHPALLAFASRIAWWFAGIITVGLFLWTQRTRWHLNGRVIIWLAVIVSGLGGGLALIVTQSQAPYSTTYCYGRSRATHGLLRRYTLAFHRAHPAARLMVPFDVIQGQVPLPEFVGVFVNEWFASQSQGSFLRTLRDPGLGLAIIDSDFSSVYTLRMRWYDPEVQALLAREFIEVPLGTATGWVRRELFISAGANLP